MKKAFIFGFILFVFALSFGQDNITKQIDEFFQKAEKNNFSGNVLVVNDGKIILQKGYGLHDREKGIKAISNAVFDIGSITKQFTAAGILKLEMMGKLNTNDLLSKYFPEIPADKKEITLHHLLTHSSGFAGAIGDDYDPINADEFIRLAFNDPLNFKPGEQYDYSNVGFSILGIIIEKLSGKSYEQFLRDEIFSPAGMLKTGYVIPEYDQDELSVTYFENGDRFGTLNEKWPAAGPGWHLKGNGGILTTSQDMFKWYEALNGNKILNAIAKEKYFSPHIKEYPDGDSYYGYGWVVMDTPEGKLIFHNGGNTVSFNTFMGFNQQLKTCVLVNVNIGGKISDDYALKVYDILKGSSSSTDPSISKNYSGIYKTNDGATFTIKFDEFDRLIVDFDSKEAFNLLLTEGSEESAQTLLLNNKTYSMLDALFKQNYEPLANAWDMPASEFAAGPGERWQQIAKDQGGYVNFEIFGSARRSSMNAYITMAKINFKNKPVYMMYVWRNNMLSDARELDHPDKIFEMENDTSYFAPNNKKRILLEDGKVIIVSGNVKSVAVKM